MQILRIVYIHVLELLQTLFLSHSLPKWKQKNSFQSFAPKQWTTPFRKMENLRLNSVFFIV